MKWRIRYKSRIIALVLSVTIIILASTLVGSDTVRGMPLLQSTQVLMHDDGTPEAGILISSGTIAAVRFWPYACTGLDQQQTSTSQSLLFGGNLTKVQTFTPSKNQTLCKVEVFLSAVSGLTHSGITVGIYQTDAAGKPTGSALGTSSIASFSSTSGAWKTASFGGVALNGSSVYAIVLSSPNSSNGAYRWYGNTGNPYAGGQAWRNGAGSSWQNTSLGSGYDFAFKTYYRVFTLQPAWGHFRLQEVRFMSVNDAPVEIVLMTDGDDDGEPDQELARSTSTVTPVPGSWTIVSLADVGLIRPWSKCHLDQQQTQTDNNLLFGGNLTKVQTFTPGQSRCLCKVMVPLAAVSGLTQQNITLGVYATDSAGKPTGSALGSGTINAFSGTSMAWKSLSFGQGSVSLTKGNTYAVVLSAPSSSNGAYRWYGNTGNPYANGQAWRNTATGWGATSLGNNYDFAFKTHLWMSWPWWIHEPIFVGVRPVAAELELKSDTTQSQGQSWYVADPTGAPTQAPPTDGNFMIRCVAEEETDPAPVADFNCGSSVPPGADMTFTDASLGDPTSWSWDFGDSVGTSTDQNPTYAYADPGTYTVALTVENSGGIDSTTAVVQMEDWYWKPGGWSDYAPSGMPDFDQRQDQWDKPPGSQNWTYCGPVAVANCLWWFDSKNEPNPVPPPTINDGYPLVEAYGVWDDHDAQNVQPLVDDLAARMKTDGDPYCTWSGTYVSDMAAGIKSYLAAKGLSNEYSVVVKKAPTFEWVEAEVERCEDVILLLGFWEYGAEEWKRVGGHYVTVAGVDSKNMAIAFSDPIRDNAEAGGPGRVLPVAHPPGHASEYHNDAQYVSHDVYYCQPTDSPGGGWGPEGYVADWSEMEGLATQNRAQDTNPYLGDYTGGPIVTEVDYAVAVSPREKPVVWVEPSFIEVKKGDTFTVDIMTWVDDLYGAEFDLDFDPAVVMATDVVTGTIFASGWAAQRFIGADIVEYGATLLKPDPAFNGVGTIVSIEFQAVAPGVSELHLHDVILAEPEGVAIPDVSTVDGEVVVLGWGSLEGIIELQGRSDIVAPGPDWDGAVITATQGYSYTATVMNLDGTWSIPEVVAGIYTIEVEMEGYLDAWKEDVAVQDGAITTLSQVKLLGGDSDDSDMVNILDLGIIGGAYGTAPLSDDRADINDDGLVNILDLVLAGGNYWESSPVPWP